MLKMVDSLFFMGAGAGAGGKNRSRKKMDRLRNTGGEGVVG